MRLTPRVRFALVAIAVALLVTGLFGPVRRALDDRERAQRTRAIAEEAQRERTQAASDYKANRERILAEVKDLIARDDHVGAMKVAGRFLEVGDEEIKELHRDAARNESLRQRSAHYQGLVERTCTEAHARAQVLAIFATVPSGAPPPEPPLRLERLPVVEARALVLARMREPPPKHAHERGAPAVGLPAATGAPTLPAVVPGAPAMRSGTDEWVANMRADNRARLLPDFLGFMYSPDANKLICAWRAEGERRVGTRVFNYTASVWLAPSPDGKELRGDPVVYTERYGP